MLNKLRQGHWPLFLLSSFSSFANLFLPIILVRIITPSDMGIYKIFFLHLSILPFLFLTGGPANSVYYWIGKEKESRDLYIQSCWTLTTALSALILIIGFPLSSYFSDYLGIEYQYIVYMLIAAFMWVPSSHYAECSVASGKTLMGSIYGTSFDLAKVILFILAAYFLKDIKYIFIIHASLMTIKFITTFILGSKNNYISLKIDIQKIKDVFWYSFPISLSGLLGFFVDKIDMLILSGQLTTEEFAFYSMGCLIIPPLYILDTSVQKVLIPNLSRSYIKQEFEVAISYYRKAISDLSFLIIPAMFGLIVFAKPIITLLYTDKYQDSVIFLQIFSLSYILNLIPHDAVPRATGKSSWILKIYLITTPLSLICVFLSAKYFGAKEALITALILKLLPKLVGVIYSASIMNWKVMEMFPWKRIFIFFTISGILSFISIILRNQFPTDMYWFYICSPIFALIYLGSLYKPFKKGII